MRKIACETLNNLVKDNDILKDITIKWGGLQLVARFKYEKEMPVKEALLDTLNHILTGRNYLGKKLFIWDAEGINFIYYLLT